MPGETIEHPEPGWNELPNEPGTYAWWDGNQFTTVAFRAKDHWEFVRDDSPSMPPSPKQSRRSKKVVVSIGVTLGVFVGLTVVAFLVLVVSSTVSWQSRVREVHRQLEAMGLQCANFSVVGPQIGSDPGYAEGTCKLDANHNSTEVVIRAEQNDAVEQQAAEAMNPAVVGSGWWLQTIPENPALARDIAVHLNARCLRCD